LAAELHSFRSIRRRPTAFGDLQLFRGDLKIYLTEGVLSFAAPLAGRRVAVVFTTAHSEGGDGEVLTFPPQRSERASLLHFSKTPIWMNIFNSAVFFFSDNTAEEVTPPDRRAAGPLGGGPCSGTGAGSKQHSAREQFRRSRFDWSRRSWIIHPSARGFFYGDDPAAATRAHLTSDTDPDKFEPVSIGALPPPPFQAAESRFQVWTSFRPRGAAPFVSNAGRLNITT